MLGSACPLSSRAMVDWLVPMRTANSAWDSPARKVALTSSAEIVEFRGECVVVGLDLGVGEKASLELGEWNGHVMSAALRRASLISARGVFCVFFTKARTTTIFLPTAVT